MKRTYLICLTAVGLALARSIAPGASEAPPRPNIVVIVADDLGWANVGYHGSSIPTPRLDELAAKGRRLEQHYVSPVCSPTRTALMTGRYASRFGVTTPQNDRALPLDTVTIARALKSVGYDTALAGKWHLGSDPNWGPQRFGFDDSYGSLAGGVGPYDHHYKQGPYTRTWHRNGHLLEESGHVTDLIAREATRWLETRGDRPFFLYVPFTAPHIPIKEPPEWLERCRHIADPQERLFAACVAHLDDAIGRILDALDRNAQRDRTLVLFFSDNGAPRGARNDDPLYPADGYAAGPCSGQNAPLRGFKAQLYEGGIRVPAILSWPARLKPGRISTPLHAVDWMPTFCRLAGYQPASDLQWDGRDVWPVLAGEQKPEPRVLYWAGTGFRSRAVRQGDWKLIVESDKAGNLARQLFDLAQDPSEQKNQAIARADLADRLAQLLETQAALDNTRLARDPVPPAAATAPAPSGIALVRTIDLELGEEQEVELADGHRARVQLIDLVEERDPLRQAIRAARATVNVNGIRQVLTSATYHLPVTVAGVQIDCPITRGYADPDTRKDVWALRKAARFRLWPAGSPWMPPGAFGYPVRQRWFASGTQMANEPTFVDGGEAPGVKSIYYHWGLDFGGAEAMVEIVAATDGLVVTAGGPILAAYTNSPASPRSDVIYVVDGRGWFYRYSHLCRIDVVPGQTVQLGQRLGLLGKEGGSGGWSHLHFDITSRQPSGQWGIQDAYAYAWEAWAREHAPRLIAVARPHHFAAVNQPVTLDATRSWSATGDPLEYAWTFSDGTAARGARVTRAYSIPGTYSEVLKVTDAQGTAAYDFAVVQVADPENPTNTPPSIHAVFYPTTGLRSGDEITFKVRSFRAAGGEEWDFGDGSPRVRVKSDGNARTHAPDGYAVTTHRYARPGHYLASVQHINPRGEPATARLWIEVQ